MYEFESLCHNAFQTTFRKIRSNIHPIEGSREAKLTWCTTSYLDFVRHFSNYFQLCTVDSIKTCPKYFVI